MFSFKNLTVIQKAISLLFLFSTLCITFLCFFSGFFHYSYAKDFEFPNFLYALFGLAAIALAGVGLFRLVRDDVLRRKDIVLVFSVSLGLFLFLLIATHSYYFQTGWDVNMVFKTASQIAHRETVDENAYFSIYPNNLFLTLFFSTLIRIGNLFGFFTEYYTLILFQCFFLILSGIFVFFSMHALFGKKAAAYLSWLIFLILAVLSPWVIVPYSDTMGLFLLSAIFFLYTRKKMPLLFGFLIMTGYYIKPTILIFGIAALIVHLPALFAHWKDKRFLKNTLLLLAGLFLGFGMVKFSEKISPIEVNPEKTFGISHFVMMGLNEEANGVINLEDQDFSMNISTARERTAENNRIALERLQNLGFSGLAKHLSRKVLTSFNDGTFAWACEGEFFSIMIWTGHPELEKIFRSFYYPEESNYHIFLNVAQSIWMAVLILGLFGAFSSPKKETLTLQLVFIGNFLFELIFEPRARHLLVFLPVFIYLAVNGFLHLFSAGNEPR